LSSQRIALDIVSGWMAFRHMTAQRLRSRWPRFPRRCGIDGLDEDSGSRHAAACDEEIEPPRAAATDSN
jgi:hypothetical protein